MKRIAMSLIAAASLLVATAAAQENVSTLRPTTPLAENASAAPMPKVENTDIRQVRNYPEQPPLIPHKIDAYQIDLKVNQCMRCHDWPFNVEENAPKISETHYTNREGVALDHVARNRWFCTQCHVPQANARALVDNRFKSAVDLD